MNDIFGEVPVCGRCGRADRDVRSTIANLEREHREDGVAHEPPAFAVEDRCRDRAACAARVRARSAA